MFSYYERLWCCDTIAMFRGVVLSFAICTLYQWVQNKGSQHTGKGKHGAENSIPYRVFWCKVAPVLVQRMKKTKLAKNYIVSSFLKHQFDTSLNNNFLWEGERIHLFCPWFNNVTSGSSALSLTKYYVLWKKEIIVLMYLNTSKLVSKCV